METSTVSVMTPKPAPTHTSWLVPRAHLDVEAVREIVRASRDAQGLPLTVADPAILSRVATLLQATGDAHCDSAHTGSVERGHE